MAKLEALTAEQEKQLVEWRDRWLAVGRATGPVDRAPVEEVFKDFYRRLNLAEPVVVWCQSPWQAGVIGAVLETLPAASELPAFLQQLGKAVKAKPRSKKKTGEELPLAERWKHLFAMLRPLLNQYAPADFWPTVIGREYGDGVDDELCRKIWQKLVKQLGKALTENQRKQANRFFCGQHESSWIAHYLFCRDVLGLDYGDDNNKLLDLWAILCKSGWWQARAGLVLACERPSELHLDGDGRLHNESGPAMAFTDSYAVWSIGGVRVNEQIVMRPETQTLAEIDGEQNAEIRRIRIERYTWVRYLRESNAKVIDTRDNDIEATKESLMQIGSGERILVCHCPSTARVYAMQVADDVQTCEAAQKFLWSGNRYASGQRGITIIGRT